MFRIRLTVYTSDGIHCMEVRHSLSHWIYEYRVYNSHLFIVNFTVTRVYIITYVIIQFSLKENLFY